MNLGRQTGGGGFGKGGSTAVPLSACWQGLLLECRTEARDGSGGDMQDGLFGQLGSGCVCGSVGTFLLVKPFFGHTGAAEITLSGCCVSVGVRGWHPPGWRCGVLL